MILLMQTVGQRIAARRRQLGLTQIDLAHRAGMSRRWLIMAERSPHDPSLQLGMLRRIAKALGVSVGWLADGTRRERLAA
jgi:transcriptional regulator with XRE-family HTH domain